MNHEWPLTETRNLPWHALQRTLASDFASRLIKKEPLTTSSAGPGEMTSWLVRALVDASHTPIVQ
ncbi:MAG TPA: hypothetical protein VGI93_14030 [Steroidobacteraceae bacterium]|jgi:hypothetical protein